MRAVIQRVKNAHVDIIENGSVVRRSGEIGKGLLLLLAVEKGDNIADAEWIAAKATQLRIFEDGDGKMNRSLLDSGGDILLVSQFTLYGNLRKGSRPSFNRSAKPEISNPLYERFCSLLEEKIGKPVQRGVFGAYMELSLVNDGPVTIILDSRNKDL